MFISVQELELKKVHFDVAFPPGEIDFQDDGDRLKQATPLQAEGAAELLPHTLGEIRVRGHLAVTMQCECNRCLEPARFPIDSSFDLFYRPIEGGSDEEEAEIDEGEAEIAFYEGDGIKLEEILREHVLLNVPMQRVCRADCLGICPVCGQNRNLINCGCEAKLVDDRWSALKKVHVKGT
ncbi:MAG TPA: DUF177 domain-containing protein [Bryobacteraceae bacterium]|nr:DUF177 domain-containing protein [Bryobacteraceae bacterium]